MRGSDLRSVNRKSMDLIFAPVDPKERLPRELLDEGSLPGQCHCWQVHMTSRDVRSWRR